MINTAFILDIKNSREMAATQRRSAQERLSDAADFANSVYKNKMKCKLDFSSGDSIQGLFTDPSSAVCCYTLIRSAVVPNKIRCGIGAGDLVDMPYTDSNRMDGTSYHNARDALSFSKENGYEVLFRSGCATDRFVNQYLAAAQVLMSKQSSKQEIISNLIFLLDPLTDSDLDRSEYDKGVRKFIDANISVYGRSPDVLPAVPVLSGRSGTGFNEKTIDRNIQTTLGKMLGVTSENIRQMIIRGDVEMVRSLFISAYMIAEQFLGSEERC
jgi:hypothetical protein